MTLTKGKLKTESDVATKHHVTILILYAYRIKFEHIHAKISLLFGCNTLIFFSRCKRHV